MKRFLKNQQGYSMVELMIAFSIFTILMMVVYSTFFSQYRGLTGQMEMASLNADANRALKYMKATINDYGSIDVSNGQVSSSSIVIIDANNDDVLEGSEISLDNKQHALIDSDGLIIASNVSDINVIIGPGSIDDVTVVEGVVLIQIVMSTRNTSYEVKGGINVSR